MLEIEHLTAGYDGVTVLNDLSLKVAQGDAVAVLGRNGAGKTTLLRAIAGQCQILSGTVSFGGNSLGGLSAHERARIGIAQVPEGRRVWASMTVRENLLMGSWRFSRPTRTKEANQLLGYVLELFPRLSERIDHRAEVLSGGEAQMVAIGRALMSRPDLILIDEPSIGLAPVMVEVVMEALHRLRKERSLAIILVDQRIREALELCDRTYLLNRGRLQINGVPSADLSVEDVSAAYLG
jgi:branched-chain amino acid transport system ATP-binding protein